MKFKKIRKVFRVIFPKRLNSIEVFENNLKNDKLILSYEKINEEYELKLENGIRLRIRNENYSDYLVYRQIFKDKEYELVLNMIHSNMLSKKQNIIIDAGANVGYTTVFFAHNLKGSKIFAIEPSIENVKIFDKNISYLSEARNVKLYPNALTQDSNLTFSIDRSFRDGKDWSISTIFDFNGNIKGISLDDIVKENNIEYITLLKVDIEGAERFIFNFETDVSFLNLTLIIAIEIHDEFNTRDLISSLLRKKGFFLIESGELTIGINLFLFSNGIK